MRGNCQKFPLKERNYERRSVVETRRPLHRLKISPKSESDAQSVISLLEPATKNGGFRGKIDFPLNILAHEVAKESIEGKLPKVSPQGAKL